MLIYEEFENITIEYEKKIWEIFKRTIDTATIKAIKEGMDPLDEYAFVNNAVENAFRELASVQGYNHDNPYISDALYEKIFEYYEPLAEAARVDLQNKINDMMNSNYVGELMGKLENFREELESKGLAPSFYEEVSLKKRV